MRLGDGGAPPAGCRGIWAGSVAMTRLVRAVDAGHKKPSRNFGETCGRSDLLMRLHHRAIEPTPTILQTRI
jgi:hypothetical protein